MTPLQPHPSDRFRRAAFYWRCTLAVAIAATLIATLF
jgi:hypothetical protein